jgi:hypothetical protein
VASAPAIVGSALQAAPTPMEMGEGARG